MLKAALCVILAVTAAMAWQALSPVPSPADEENGSHITWGAGSVWGLFPNSANDVTYSAYYDGSWHTIDDASDYALQYTGLTFQWLEDGVLFAIGNEDGDPHLYWYSLDAQDWDSDDLPFNISYGACIAYQPNGNYNSELYPVPGWIYRLAGNGKGFWRYSIPSSLPEDPVSGIYPGQGATIADATPLFQWGSSATTEYRLQVSTDSTFNSTVIDITESQPQHQVTSALTNGRYFWRTAIRIGLSWSWSANSHNVVIDAGWVQLEDIPTAVAEGAAMAYDGDALSHPSIMVLIGGGNRGYYEYNITGTPGYRWNALTDAQEDEDAGTSLTTHDATRQSGLFPWASFGGSTTSDNPWYYDVYANPQVWVEWIDNSINSYYRSYYPQSLGPGACMVYGSNDNQYLIVGEDDQGYPRSSFYRVDPPSSLMDGGQASVEPAGVTRAHVVSGYDAVGVEYQLSTSAPVRATLHDVLGRQIGELDAGEQKAGTHRLSWDHDSEGRKLSSGAYFILLDIGTEQARLKAVVR